MVDIKSQIRDRAEMRFFAMETLKGIVEWIKETNPQQYIETTKKDEVISGEEFKAKMRDWINKSGDLIEKTWELPYLLAEDAIRVLREATKRDESEPERTSESK